MKLTTCCFEKAGAHNTDYTLQIAHERAKTLGIRQVVVASSHGETARKAHTLFAPGGIKVIAVTIGHGLEGAGWLCFAVKNSGLAWRYVLLEAGGYFRC